MYLGKRHVFPRLLKTYGILDFVFWTVEDPVAAGPESQLENDTCVAPLSVQRSHKIAAFGRACGHPDPDRPISDPGNFRSGA